VEVVQDEGQRRYNIPSGYGEALTDRTSLAYASALARQILVSGFKLGAVVDAHRSGGGVSWAEFGDEMREAQGDLNRPVLENVLAQEWFAAVPEIRSRLVPGSRVADMGTGHGWASIGIARTFDGVRVDGFDIDSPSIDKARRHATDAGLSDRVRFHAIDAGDPWITGEYDLVLAIEMIHDLPDPVATLSTMRRIVAEDGLVVVADMNVAPEFDPDAGDLERLMYGFSNFLCLPDGKAHGPTAATGTVMRPSTLRDYARKAGFGNIEELPIETDFWKFYKLI
jgi:2-polyprenyl-3-methyl-5-hydroxy-6-metoxy-1,4-benzoquinol methylase